MDDTNYKALATLGMTFAIETIGLLTRKGLVTSAEAREIFDRCLLNLETQNAIADAGDKRVFAVARQICEASLDQLAVQNRNPRQQR